MSGPDIRLPKRVEADPRGPDLLRDLTTHARPLWPGGTARAADARLTPELRTVLGFAHRRDNVVRGLEYTEKLLAGEERGLRLADTKAGEKRGGRVSRVLFVAADGSERFYRQVDTLLRRHEPRVLAVRLDVSAEELGGALFGEGRIARLVLVSHKDAVSEALLALAGQWG